MIWFSSVHQSGSLKAWTSYLFFFLVIVTLTNTINVLMSSFLPVHLLPCQTFIELCSPVQETTGIHLLSGYSDLLNLWSLLSFIAIAWINDMRPEPSLLICWGLKVQLELISKNIFNTGKIATTESVRPSSQVLWGPTNKAFR